MVCTLHKAKGAVRPDADESGQRGGRTVSAYADVRNKVTWHDQQASKTTGTILTNCFSV